MPDSRWKLVSIRTLCGEGDGRRGKAERHQFQHFYPRPPQGGRPTIRRWTMPSGQFLSTPSARRATCAVTAFRKQLQIISIHALREEGDGAPHPAGARTQHFYPRPPRGGRPACASMSFITVSPFLSTPSARRATQQQQGQRQGLQISIHAIREEGDSSPKPSLWKPSNFYPRPPRGGRLAVVRRSKRRSNISIHALHEEGDSATRRPGPSTGYFYPRPPRGGRQSGRAGNNPDKRFLSTPSARRATHLTMLLSSENHISIHALREEGDKDTEGQKQQMNIFLSTPSARRATSSKKPR